MAMSRIARILAALAAAAAPTLAAADPGLVAAPPDPLGDIARAAARGGHGFSRCDSDDPASIIVCGRRAAAGAAGYRVPYEPVPGEVHHIAGDLPSGTGAMGADGCLRLCEQPLKIDIIGAARTLGHGIDRLLHPD
jgi:hypothetical protein